jgi:hypothetical protein
MGGIMGKDKRLIRIITLIWCISLGLILSSCQPINAEPGPPCGNMETDFMWALPSMREQAARYIEADICISGGKDKYTVVTDKLDGEQQKVIKEIPGPFPVAELVANFKIQDTDGKTVTEFPSALEIRVTYYAEAWADVQERGFEVPRLAYLVREGDGWGTSWIEFTKENATIEIFPPGTEGQPEDRGLIIIKLKKLPDPAIGGC